MKPFDASRNFQKHIVPGIYPRWMRRRRKFRAIAEFGKPVYRKHENRTSIGPAATRAMDCSRIIRGIHRHRQQRCRASSYQCHHLARQNGDNPFLIFIGNIPDGQFGWQASPRCSRENRLHNETIINQDGGNQDCWWVRTASLGRGLLRYSANKQSHSHENAKQVLEWVHRSGVNIPDRGDAVGFHMADDRDILIIDYYFDRPRNQTDLPVANNGSFLDRIIAWGNDWNPKIVSGFYGEISKQGKSK